MSSMNTLILSIKVFIISAGVLSLAFALKLSAPVAVNSIPATWSIVMEWMKPPYLYLIINGIIITIVATSRFHQSKPHHHEVHYDSSISVVRAVPLPEFSSFSVQPVIDTFVEEQAPVVSSVVVYENDDLDRVADVDVEVKHVMGNGLDENLVTEEEMVAEKEAGDVFVESSTDDIFIGQTKYVNDSGYSGTSISQAKNAKDFRYHSSRQEVNSTEIRQLESLFPAREKPLVTARFGHRKPVRTNPEGGKALRVTRPKKQDTLESTWKMITEGRHVPLTRHFKKVETFDQRVSPTTDQVQKSETFKDRTSFELSNLRVRKEPSLGQDELNRRVEAFIKKFNEDMRIQRQESLNQYMEMIGRGV